MSVGVCMPTYGQKPEQVLSVLLSRFPAYTLETRFLTEPGAKQMAGKPQDSCP